MDIWETDAWAAHVYGLAGFDGSEPVSPVKLGKAILGPESLRIVPHAALPGDAKLAVVNGVTFIFARKGLTRERLLFGVAHELAELVLRGHIDPTIEDACNAIAGAILAPRKAFASVLRAVGEDFTQLALPFHLTETGAALRLGEITDRPLVAISPQLVRVRGRDWSWPPEEEIRRIARGPSRPGVRKVQLTDDRRRVVLLGEEIEDVG